jgi:IS5 family transposase
VDLPAFDSFKASRHLAVMTTLDREIDLSKGKREATRTRRRRYQSLLWRARRTHRLLNDAVVQVEAALGFLDVLPSRRAMAERAVQRLRGDVDALAQVIANCEARVIQDRKVAIADKKLSVSDPDVGFIAKGQREPVIGYKPQVARSGAGFITGLLLPKGNAADSEQLVPMVDAVVRRTGVVPRVLSVDDGYASAANVAAMKVRQIEVISINGSKGRALTARADWNSDEYALARDQRSAMESLMFTLKQGFDFGEVARRGLVAAHGELLEKALAYNLCHLARMRRAMEAEAKNDDELVLAQVA